MSKNENRLPLKKIGCVTLSEEKEKVWFLGLKTNELYEFNRSNLNTKTLKQFTDASGKERLLYLSIEKVGDILVLGPGAVSHIAFYNLADGTCEYMELAPVENNRKIKYNGVCNFCKSYTYGNSVYLFGYKYPAILKIDMGAREIVYFTDWVMEVERRILKTYDFAGYVSDYVIVDNFVWMLCECVGTVLRLDLRTDEIEVLDILSDLDIQCGICFDGNFWVAGNHAYGNKLLKYDEQFMLEKEITIYSVGDSEEVYDFSLDKSHWATYPVIDLGKKLLLFSVYPSHVYEFDKASEQVRIHPVFEEALEVRDERLYSLKILVPRRKEDCLCFVTGNDFLWHEYDFVHDTVTQYEVRAEWDEEVLQEYTKVLVGKVMAENNFVWNLGYKLTLPRFLEHTKYVLLEENVDMGKNDNVGAGIHKECWEALDI